MNRADYLASLVSLDTDACVLWPYALDKHGYGRIKTATGTGLVTRLSCTVAHGEPPTPKHQAAHSCHTPSCVNPRHLRWATARENAADRIKDGTHHYGETSNSAKMTEQVVWQIRFFSRGGIPQTKLAQHFGVTQSAVSRMLNGITWSHVIPC